MIKKLKKRVVSLLVIAIGLSATPVMAATTDLGHGSGCEHNHTSACYHQHISDCYHVHTSACYQYHSHTDSCYTTGYHNVKNYSSSSTKMVMRCDGCGNEWNGNCHITYCLNCYEDAYPDECPRCDRLCFHSSGVSNYTRDCKRLSCSKTQDLVCGKTTSTAVCGISTSAPKCGQDGMYTNCVVPTITYTMPSQQWTNKNVTVNYSGTQSGSISFAENGSKSVTVTSSTGHRIRESITVKNIDKVIPQMPNYKTS